LKRWNSGKIHNDVENYITIKEDKRYKWDLKNIM
jgi:hypothetical protein